MRGDVGIALELPVRASQLLVRLLARGHVARHLRVAAQLAVLGPQRRDDDVRPEARSVLAHAPSLVLVANRRARRPRARARDGRGRCPPGCRRSRSAGRRSRRRGSPRSARRPCSSSRRCHEGRAGGSRSPGRRRSAARGPPPSVRRPRRRPRGDGRSRSPIPRGGRAPRRGGGPRRRAGARIRRSSGRSRRAGPRGPGSATVSAERRPCSSSSRRCSSSRAERRSMASLTSESSCCGSPVRITRGAPLGIAGTHGISALHLLGQRHARGVGVPHRDEGQLAVRLDEIRAAPVREAGHGESGRAAPA